MYGRGGNELFEVDKNGSYAASWRGHVPDSTKTVANSLRVAA